MKARAFLTTAVAATMILGASACSSDTTRGTPGAPDKSGTSAPGPTPYKSDAATETLAPANTADPVLTAQTVMTGLAAAGLVPEGEDRTAGCLAEGCTQRVATTPVTITSYPDAATATGSASGRAAGVTVIDYLVIAYGNGADRAAVENAVRDQLGEPGATSGPSPTPTP